MRHLPSMLLVALLAAGAAILCATAGSLPAVVASHFDLAGYANGTMSRASYLVFMSLMMFGVPLLVVEANARTPARIDSDALWMLFGTFVLATLAWQFFRWRRFRRPD